MRLPSGENKPSIEDKQNFVPVNIFEYKGEVLLFF